MDDTAQTAPFTPPGVGPSGIVMLAAAWLVISGLLMNAGGAPRWNDVLVGLVVLGLAAIRFYTEHSSVALSWVNIVLGLWTIASPWLLGFAGNAAITTGNVIAGVAIVVLGLFAAFSQTAAQP